MTPPPPAAASRNRRAGFIGAIAGLAAAGVAAGVATERYLINKARTDPHDPYIDEPFGELSADRIQTVTTADGVPLHVEIVESPGEEAAATAVFVHGYCLDEGTFHFQRRGLEQSGLPVRAVYYDQPGHGQSGELPKDVYGIDELADSLYAVIAQTVPSGPIILTGHSMGAMTIMVFARRYPKLFAERVKGVALLSTSGGGLDKVTFGAPRALMRARRLFLPLLTRAASLTPAGIDHARRVAGDLAWVLTRRYGFATSKPSPNLVSYVEYMNTNTPIKTVIGYALALLEHDERDKLDCLSDVPVLVCCGKDDNFTPAEHSVLLSQLLPHSRLVLIPEAGHVAVLEKPDAVTQPLLETFNDILSALGSGAPVSKSLRSGESSSSTPFRRKNRSQRKGV
ncbi:MAG TPA: alpha/beta hydrolase [Candidatus Stackebrandtia faecavium]|nr:alpha/beta hydrolase [Candidatus Stackebrandtia faecavium]